MDAYAPPRQIAALLSDYTRPWCFCGGWAIDLFLNRVTRSHKDVDVSLSRGDQLAMQHYLAERGWTLEQAVQGQLITWRVNAYLSPPVHTIWCKHATYQPDFLELLFDEMSETHFIFRREPTITRARDQMTLHSSLGLPILAPEIVLLYKAQPPVAREHISDCLNTWPYLSGEQSDWLRNALRRLYPDHPWLHRV